MQNILDKLQQNKAVLGITNNQLTYVQSILSKGEMNTKTEEAVLSQIDNQIENLSKNKNQEAQKGEIKINLEKYKELNLSEEKKKELEAIGDFTTYLDYLSAMCKQNETQLLRCLLNDGDIAAKLGTQQKALMAILLTYSQNTIGNHEPKPDSLEKIQQVSN